MVLHPLIHREPGETLENKALALISKSNVPTSKDILLNSTIDGMNRQSLVISQRLHFCTLRDGFMANVMFVLVLRKQ